MCLQEAQFQNLILRKSGEGNPYKRKTIEELYEQGNLTPITEFFSPKVLAQSSFFFLFHSLLFASWHNRVLSFFFYILTVYFSSSSFTSQAFIDLFRPHLIVSLKGFQVVFIHFIYNSALFFASWCPFLLHVAWLLFYSAN